MSYIYTFLQSNILEWCIYLPMLRLARPDLRLRDRMMVITSINAITHPLVFFFIMNMRLPYIVNISIAETFAIVAEALILCSVVGVRRRDAWISSAIANLISWQIAPMLTYSLWS